MKQIILALVCAVIAAGVAYWILGTAPAPVPSEESSAVSVSTEVSAPVAAAPSATATAASVSTNVLEEFARKTESVFATLPRISELRALPAEQVHTTPAALINAGAAIGEVAEAIEKNPALAPQGIAFYGKCARAGDISVSVRAVCLHDLRSLSLAAGGAADESGITPDVLKAAELLK
jgi:hypothetical protein